MSSFSPPTPVPIGPAFPSGVPLPLPVAIQPSTVPDPGQQPSVALYELIIKGTAAISFNNYSNFIQSSLCTGGFSTGDANLDARKAQLDQSGGVFTGMRAYEYVRDVSEIFLMSQAAVAWPGYRAPTVSGVASSTTTRNFGFTGEDAGDVSERFNGAPVDAAGLEALAGRMVGRSATSGEPLDMLPFLRAVRGNLSGIGIKNGVAGDANCTDLLRGRLQCPMLIELIWSYWMEQAMLVQGLAAISMRFQNRRLSQPDPLARMEVTCLRPMTNLFWGYIQHEPDRLSVQRRALEYQHAYGLVIGGRAISQQMMPADPRPRFLEAFHALLREADRFYRIQADLTYRPDAFRVLNSLKELHLILAEGMHNQYGDLPSTARAEMLLQQFLLARPEMRDFLGGRPSVPFPEPWMPHLETLRQIFGWADASVRYYHDLATLGEQLLLSVRFWNWSVISDQQEAAAWLTFWRPQIQSYIHAYRAVTGVDLSVEEMRPAEPAALSTQPSDLIVRRRALASAARV